MMDEDLFELIKKAVVASKADKLLALLCAEKSLSVTIIRDERPPRDPIKTMEVRKKIKEIFGDT